MSYRLVQGDVLEVTRGYPDNYFDGLFCDPPYGLSFMGKGWDTFSTSQNKALGGQSPANRASKVFPHRGKPIRGWCEADRKAIYNFQEFMTEWAKEALRVLKPGAFGLVFGGTRTWHRLACALEDAGFEMRNTLMWLYGSGFPKSFDISKGIDKDNDKWLENFQEFGDYVKRCRVAKGLSLRKLDNLMGTNTAASWWEGRKSGVQLPSLKTYKQLKKILDMDNRYDYLIEWAEAEREVVGKHLQPAKEIYQGGELPQDVDLTLPATDPAKQWNGYGTALKPSWEPVLLIRKPLDGNNVQNALKHGCGGLNIDGSRIPTNGEQPRGSGGSVRYSATDHNWGFKGNEGNITPPQGRWPANLILDEDAAAMLDAQSGESVSQGGMANGHMGEKSSFGIPTGRRNVNPYAGDTGGASRFFYCAKASRTERNAGAMELYWRKDKTRDSGHVQITREEWERLGEEEERIYKETGKRVSLRARGNIHTTVKPLDMVRWLAKLILPPEREGDPRRLNVPFCGSGSEMIGGLQVGWDMVDGIDIEADYLKIADARLKHWIARMQAKAPLFAEAK